MAPPTERRSFSPRGRGSPNGGGFRGGRGGFGGDRPQSPDRGHGDRERRDFRGGDDRRSERGPGGRGSFGGDRRGRGGFGGDRGDRGDRNDRHGGNDRGDRGERRFGGNDRNSRGGPRSPHGMPSRVIIEEFRVPGVYTARGKKDMLVTRSFAPGTSVYGEKHIQVDSGKADGTKIEYREWNPFRSKLGAALISGLGECPIVPGKKVLYLGAASGTTVSHVSDIVGSNWYGICC
eukprot:gnl/Chilomastix_caulleri/973.p1 GENE.gnl/Chilomastix_caulleri/973~~gnl/Chilomastix_caulleri/973.p1  ORF type:complete len:241 (-),score=104.73 gnl/Chilomastix_caulleri/973:2-703(-)